MDTELQIAQLNKRILETKMTDPTNFLLIRKLQMELEKLYENRNSAN